MRSCHCVFRLRLFMIKSINGFLNSRSAEDVSLSHFISSSCLAGKELKRPNPKKNMVYRPYAGVDYNQILCPLQSRLQYIYQGGNRREIIYCKRAILVLSSSKILTPSPPGECVLPPPPPQQQRRGTQYTLAGRRGGWGGSIFWETREIGLPSYSK
jgi:hypothetical protein